MTMPVFEAKTLRIGLETVDPRIKGPASENRAANSSLKLPALSRALEARDGRVAIVGFGPSLADTWQALRYFDGPIWTTSAAHDFLLERGVVPTFHTDTDHREHKAHYNSAYSDTTRYRIATSVHPLYIERLLGKGPIELFHLFLPAYGPYEPGYWRVDAEYDVGQTTARLAYLKGWREQHWFGFDYSSGATGTHAGPHAGVGSPPVGIEVRGRQYESSELHIQGAMGAERLLRTLPKLRVEIHGDGMLLPFLTARGRNMV